MLKSGAIVNFFDKPGDAYREGPGRYPDKLFSIQEVRAEPLDIGFPSYATDEVCVSHYVFRIGPFANGQVTEPGQAAAALPHIIDEFDGFGWGTACRFRCDYRNGRHFAM